MRTFLIEFLKQLEEAIPTTNKSIHHAIHYGRYGSDETGWEEKLCLTVNLNKFEHGFQTFFLDENDFAGPPETLVKNVKELTDEILKG